MLTLFDNLKNSMWKTVNTVMAQQNVTWLSQDGLANFSGPVLLNTPTIKEITDGSGFIDAQAFMEYPITAFIGLKSRVDAKSSEEVVTIDGAEWYVRSVEKLFDGENMKAYLEQVDNPYGPQNQ